MSAGRNKEIQTSMKSKLMSIMLGVALAAGTATVTLIPAAAQPSDTGKTDKGKTGKTGKAAATKTDGKTTKGKTGKGSGKGKTDKGATTAPSK